MLTSRIQQAAAHLLRRAHDPAEQHVQRREPPQHDRVEDVGAARHPAAGEHPEERPDRRHHRDNTTIARSSFVMRDAQSLAAARRVRSRRTSTAVVSTELDRLARAHQRDQRAAVDAADERLRREEHVRGRTPALRATSTRTRIARRPAAIVRRGSRRREPRTMLGVPGPTSTRRRSCGHHAASRRNDGRLRSVPTPSRVRRASRRAHARAELGRAERPIAPRRTRSGPRPTLTVTPDESRRCVRRARLCTTWPSSAAGHDRDRGDGDVPHQAVQARCARGPCVPRRAAWSVIDRSRQLADGYEQAQPERARPARRSAAAAIGAPTSSNATIVAHADERRDHVVALRTRLLRELVHRGADQREPEARDRRVEQRDAVAARASARTRAPGRSASPRPGATSDAGTATNHDHEMPRS